MGDHLPGPRLIPGEYDSRGGLRARSRRRRNAVGTQRVDVEPPLVGRTRLPLSEDGLDVVSGRRLVPAVDAGEVGTRPLATTDGVRSPQVLNLVAARAQRDHPDEPLHERRIVVAPLLVTLDGVGRATPATDVTEVAGVFVGPPT